MKEFLFLFLFLSLPFSQALQLTRQQSEISLTDQSCEKLSSLLVGLKKWSEKVDGLSSCSIQQEKKLQNRTCQIDISECIPKKLKEYLGKTAENAGPNCFNAALVFSGVLPNLRYTKSEEIDFYLKEPLCRKKEKSESPEAGDLGLISMAGEKQEFSSMHAFIYLTDKVAFEKSGQHANDPYTLRERAETFDEYDMTPGGNSLNKLPGIRKNVDYYQCVSIERYLSDANELPSWLLVTKARIERFDSCFENYLVSGQPLSSQAQKNLLDSITALKTYYNQGKETSFNQLDSKSRDIAVFLIGSLQLKIDSIYSNIHSPSAPLRADQTLKKFSSELEQAYAELSSNRK